MYVLIPSSKAIRSCYGPHLVLLLQWLPSIRIKCKLLTMFCGFYICGFCGFYLSIPVSKCYPTSQLLFQLHCPQCSFNTSVSFWPHGLCTFSSLCLEGSAFRYSQILISQFIIQVSIHMSLHRGFPYRFHSKLYHRALASLIPYLLYFSS